MMNLANMNPAERIKASALAGLIVVALFFVIHTVLGAVAPKQASQPTSVAATGATPQPPATVQIVPPLGGAGQAVQASKPGAASVVPSVDAKAAMADPFIPLPNDTASNSAADAPALPAKKPSHTASAPTVSISPASDQTLPPPYAGGNQQLAAPQAGPLTAAPVGAPAPEIRVVGVVVGNTSVATLQVEGQVKLCRIGDSLADGYRLASIGTEGVRVLHKGLLLPLRVGSALNSTAKPGGPQ